MPITVKEIVKQWLYDNGYDGLWGDECGCDGSAPCGDGPYSNCCAAMKGPGTGCEDDGDSCDVLYYADPIAMEDLIKDANSVTRQFSKEEIEFEKMWKKYLADTQLKKDKDFLLEAQREIDRSKALREHLKNKKGV